MKILSVLMKNSPSNSTVTFGFYGARELKTESVPGQDTPHQGEDTEHHQLELCYTYLWRTIGFLVYCVIYIL
jgi:hypothetical protein